MRKKFCFIAGWLPVICSSLSNVYAAKRDDEDHEEALERLSNTGTGVDSSTLQAKLSNLENRVEDLATTMDPTALKDSLFPLGTDMVWMLLCAALALGTLGALLGLVALLRTMSFDKKIANLKSSWPTKTAPNPKVDDLHNELVAFKREFYELKEKVEEKSARPSQVTRDVSSPRENQRPMQSSPMTREPMGRRLTIEDEYRPFVDEYNEIQRATDLSISEIKEKRKEFAQRYAVQSFTCSNHQQRMNNPSLPLEFADESLVKANFWAYKLSDRTYAVVPNVRVYEESAHTSGGMGKIYDSNYSTGKSYNNIIVERPAIFGEGWFLKEKGKIILT